MPSLPPLCFKCKTNRTIHASGRCAPCRAKKCARCNRVFIVKRWINDMGTTLCGDCRYENTRHEPNEFLRKEQPGGVK